MTDYREWTLHESAAHLAAPVSGDDKYSRGVLGVITGSDRYPGAAVLGVEAAIRTGLGMVRYLGAAHELVLQRRPEVVTAPGRVQAWLIGSGIDQAQRDAETTRALCDALGEGVPVVVDSGALDLVQRAVGPVVITPHFRELARLLSAEAEQIAADPEFWCTLAAESLGVTVLLKGSRTRVAGQDGTRLVTAPATGWLASAGTGDALGGILGALVATHAEAIADDAALMAHLAATAAVIHAEAGELASSGGPLAALDVAAAVPEIVAQLLRGRPSG